MRPDGAGRRRWFRLLLALSFGLLVLSGPLVYVASVIEDEDAFVALADRAFEHPEIRREVAEAAATVAIEAVTTDETITDALPGQLRTLAVPLTRLAAREVADAAFRLLDTDVAVGARTVALREVHKQFTADRDEITIDLRAVLVRTSRELGGPAVGAGAAKVVAEQDVGRFTIAEAGSSSGALLTVVQGVPDAAAGSIGVAFLALVATVLVAPDRARALVAVGAVLIGAAVASTMIVAVVLAVAGGAVGSTTPVAVAVSDVVAADYAQHQRGAVVSGFVIAVIGVLLSRHAASRALRALPRDLWTRRPDAADRAAAVVAENPAGARLVGWVVAAFTLMSWTVPTARVVVSVVAVTAIYQGFVFVATGSRPPADRLRRRLGIVDRSGPDDDGARRHGHRRTNVAVATVLVFLVWPGWSLRMVVTFLVVGFAAQAFLEIGPARQVHRADAVAPEPERSRRHLVLAGVGLAAAVVVGVLLTGGSVDRTEAATGCNGHVELCDRRIDEVVFVGSHNAMSSIDLGWELAMQDGDMVTQLDHGVRALLIDALYWRDQGQLDGDPQIAPSVIDAALSDEPPRPGTWLCHGFCGLGATDLTAGLAGIARWLDEHPRDVLLVIVQDEVSFGDLEAAFVASGLRDQAFVRRTTEPFPTLQEMIDADRRLLVYGENGGRPDTWFQNAYADTFAETPFSFEVRTDFTCEPNRGDDANPLFLINHWLTTGIPVREAALVVNGSDVLAERVEQCREARGRAPTVIAVDFVETGDLVQFVADLNTAR